MKQKAEKLKSNIMCSKVDLGTLYVQFLRNAENLQQPADIQQPCYYNL